MAKGIVRFYVERCKACELCTNFCPKDILRLDNAVINNQGFHPVSITWMEDCTGCGVCALMCPDYVIEVERL